MNAPKPQSEADYANCYRTNQEEARGRVEMALARFRQYRQAGQITERVEGGWVFAGKDAAKVYGDLVRWQSDLQHWTLRLAEAEANAMVDRRLPREREPGEDDGPLGDPIM